MAPLRLHTVALHGIGSYYLNRNGKPAKLRGRVMPHRTGGDLGLVFQTKRQAR